MAGPPTLGSHCPEGEAAAPSEADERRSAAWGQQEMRAGAARSDHVIDVQLGKRTWPRAQVLKRASRGIPQSDHGDLLSGSTIDGACQNAAWLHAEILAEGCRKCACACITAVASYLANALSASQILNCIVKSHLLSPLSKTHFQFALADPDKPATC